MLLLPLPAARINSQNYITIVSVSTYFAMILEKEPNFSIITWILILYMNKTAIMNNKWLEWASELQSIAQAGLAFSKHN